MWWATSTYCFIVSALRPKCPKCTWVDLIWCQMSTAVPSRQKAEFREHLKCQFRIVKDVQDLLITIVWTDWAEYWKRAAWSAWTCFWWVFSPDADYVGFFASFLSSNAHGFELACLALSPMEDEMSQNTRRAHRVSLLCIRTFQKVLWEREGPNRGQLCHWSVLFNKIEEAPYRMCKSPLPAICVRNHCRQRGRCSQSLCTNDRTLQAFNVPNSWGTIYWACTDCAQSVFLSQLWLRSKTNSRMI